MRVHVAFTPADTAAAPTGIVIDVLRATSTIAQALAAGYERVLCVAEIEQAQALRAELAGEHRSAASGTRSRSKASTSAPRRASSSSRRHRTLILSTTNGTRTIVTAAERCDEVLLGSLLNLEAVVAAARERGEDVAILCAGYKGAFALDDAYCAGRIVQLLDGERDGRRCGGRGRSPRPIRPRSTGSTPARTARRGSRRTSRSAPARACSHAVPRFAGMQGAAAEIVL